MVGIVVCVRCCVQLIAMKEKLSNLLVDPAKFGMVEEIKRINCSASNALELHHRPLTWLPIPGRSKFRPGCTWRNAVLAPGRRDAQEELRRAFLEIQVGSHACPPCTVLGNGTVVQSCSVSSDIGCTWRNTVVAPGRHVVHDNCGGLSDLSGF